jgi:hypothetical protein
MRKSKLICGYETHFQPEFQSGALIFSTFVDQFACSWTSVFYSIISNANSPLIGRLFPRLRLRPEPE